MHVYGVISLPNRLIHIEFGLLGHVQLDRLSLGRTGMQILLGQLGRPLQYLNYQAAI